MNLDFIAGFLDADGHLGITLEKDNSCKFGYRRKLTLSISNKDKSVLEKVKDFLNCGNIYRDRAGFVFRTNSQKDARVVLSNFENRVHGSAKIEMPLWKEALFLCENDNTVEGFIKYIYLMYGINSKGVNRKHKIEYYWDLFPGKENKRIIEANSHYADIIRSKITPSICMNGSYVSGYFQGDGSIYLSNKARFITGFSLSDPEKSVLEKIENFLLPDSNAVFEVDPQTRENNKDYYRLQIDRLNKCKKIIIPHFDTFPIYGRQRKRYLLWREAVLLAPKTDKNRTRIDQICQLLKEL